MQVWGCGSFDNSFAVSFRRDLLINRNFDGLEEALDNLLQGESQGDSYTESAAVIAAQIISAVNGCASNEMKRQKNLNAWISGLHVSPDLEITQKCINALAFVLSEKSALFNCWKDTDDFDQWFNGINALKLSLESGVRVDFVNKKSVSLNGFAGWLIVPIFNIGVFVVYSLSLIVAAMIPYFYSDDFLGLILLGRENFSLFNVVYFLCDFICFGFLVFVALKVLILIYKKSQKAPNLAVLFFMALIGYTVVEYFFTGVLMGVENSSSDFVTFYVRPVVISALWILYFTFSKRVKATFVRE